MERTLAALVCLLTTGTCQRTAPVPVKPLPCTADTWDSYGNRFFEEQCNNCHEMTYASQRNVQMLGWSVIDAVSHGRMPPKDMPPLNTDELKRILK